MKVPKMNFKLTLLLSLGVFISCEKEIEITDFEQVNSVSVEERSTDKDGYFIEKEGVEYQDGPMTKVGDHEAELRDIMIGAKMKPRIYGPWKKMTSDVMNKLGYGSTDFNKNRFTFVLNKGPRRPKNVSVNDFKYGVERNGSARFGWTVDYRVWGVLQKNITTKKTPLKAVPGFSVRRLRNNKKTKQWMKPSDSEWKRSVINKQGWHVTGSTTMEVGASLEVPFDGGGATGGLSASMSVTLESGKSGEESTELSEGFTSAGRWVPPGKTGVFQVVERHKIVQRDWVIPIEVKGKVGANYGSEKHHGAHFWSVSAPSFFYEYNPKLTKDYKRMVIKTNREVFKEAWVRSWIE